MPITHTQPDTNLQHTVEISCVHSLCIFWLDFCFDYLSFFLSLSFFRCRQKKMFNTYIPDIYKKALYMGNFDVLTKCIVLQQTRSPRRIQQLSFCGQSCALVCSHSGEQILKKNCRMSARQPKKEKDQPQSALLLDSVFALSPVSFFFCRFLSSLLCALAGQIAFLFLFCLKLKRKLKARILVPYSAIW